jgi:hypothetical protein
VPFQLRSLIVGTEHIELVSLLTFLSFIRCDQRGEQGR